MNSMCSWKVFHKYHQNVFAGLKILLVNKLQQHWICQPVVCSVLKSAVWFWIKIRDLCNYTNTTFKWKLACEIFWDVHISSKFIWFGSFFFLKAPVTFLKVWLLQFLSLVIMQLSWKSLILCGRVKLSVGQLWSQGL